MKTLNKIIWSGVLAFVVMFALGDGKDSAVPAKAASGLVIYVDDLPDNNGTTKCPATDVHSLDDMMSRLGMSLANITIYVCPGEYIPPGDGMTFNNFTNLKIIGKGSPVIKPPAGFDNAIFNVASSTGVTIQGFVLDGGGQLNPLAVAAIWFEDTSGTITGNTISGWHKPYSGTPPFDVGLSPMHSIYVNGNGFSTKKLVISNNTVYDSQDTGILVANYSSFSTPVKIVKNRVVFGSAIIPGLAPAATVRMQAGIALVNSGPGTVISGNQVISDTDLFPTAPLYSRGIMVYGTSGTKVIGNTVRGTVAQISIENHCNLVGVSANDNVVSGNRLYDSWRIGVYITARNDTVTPGAFDCQTIPHADSITVTNNTIYNLDFGTTSSPYGHFGIYLDPVGGVIGNITVKGNTIAGYLWEGSNPNTVHFSDSNGIPNAVLGPNKIMPAPPAGVYK